MTGGFAAGALPALRYSPASRQGGCWKHGMGHPDPRRPGHRRVGSSGRGRRHRDRRWPDRAHRPALVGGAARIIDAAGLAVTPGFIDIKTHSDFTLPINPKAESKVRQGVTTGDSSAIAASRSRDAPARRGCSSTTFARHAVAAVPRDELPRLSRHLPGTAVNAGMLVGHNTLRLMAMELEDRAPTAAELDHMTLLLNEGLGAGAPSPRGRCQRPSRRARRASSATSSSPCGAGAATTPTCTIRSRPISAIPRSMPGARYSGRPNIRPT